MKTIFYGGEKAGMIVLLALTSLCDIRLVIAQDDIVYDIAKLLGLKVDRVSNINKQKLVKADLFVCCHARQIIGDALIKEYKDRIINLHPCLYLYKGADPVQRMLKDGITKASVACHHIIKEVDAGKVIIENFQEVESKDTVGVYNELYPLYVKTIIDTINLI